MSARGRSTGSVKTAGFLRAATSTRSRKISARSRRRIPAGSGASGAFPRGVSSPLLKEACPGSVFRVFKRPCCWVGAQIEFELISRDRQLSARLQDPKKAHEQGRKDCRRG